MNKKKNSLFLKIFLILISIFASFSLGISKFYFYKGSDFIKGNDYGYCDNLKAAINNYVTDYGDITIKDGELNIKSGNYRDYKILKDERIVFILHFENVDDEELNQIFKKYYAKFDIYKGEPNKNCISFALFGKNKLISYIFDPSKEVRYTQYESMIEGNFSSLSDFSFKNNLLESENFKQNLNILLNSVGETYKKSNIEKFAFKIAAFSTLIYTFSLAILFIFNKKIRYLDIIIFALSILVIYGIPYILINKANFDILMTLSLVIGIIISLLTKKEAKNE